MNNLAAVSRTKKLDRVYVDRVAAMLRPILDEDFGGNVTKMAKAMRVSQPQLSAVMTKGERGVGIMFLLAVRDYLRDRTLDEILGLDPPKAAPMSTVEAALERVIERRLSGPIGLLPPAPAPSEREAAPPPRARPRRR